MSLDSMLCSFTPEEKTNYETRITITRLLKQLLDNEIVQGMRFDFDGEGNEVLVIDKNATNKEELCRILQNIGYENSGSINGDFEFSLTNPERILKNLK